MSFVKISTTDLLRLSTLAAFHEEGTAGEIVEILKSVEPVGGLPINEREFVKLDTSSDGESTGDKLAKPE